MICIFQVYQALTERYSDFGELFAYMNGKMELRGETALHLGAEKGHLEVVKWLVEHGTGADVAAAKDKYGRTPLSYAAANGHLEVVKLLLHANADADAKDEGGRTPLSLAKWRGHGDMVALLENAITGNGK
jgi:ankyrin repeat protein